MRNKRSLIFALFLVSATARINAQTQLIIDFNNLPAIPVHKVYPYGTRIQVKVTNINTFLYNISENRADSEYNTATPSLLSTLALPPFLTSQIPAAQAAPMIAMVQRAPAALPAAAFPHVIHQELLNNLHQIIYAEEELNKLVRLHNDCIGTSKDCDLSATAIIHAVTGKIQAAANGYNIPVGTISVMADDWQTQVISRIGTADISYQQMQEIYHHWQINYTDSSRTVLADRNSTLTEAKFKLAQLTDAAKGIKDPKKAAAAQQAVLAQQHVVDRAQASVNDHADDTKTRQQDEADLMTRAKTLITDIDGYLKNGNLYTLFADLKTINENNYAFYSETIHLKKDQTRLTFTVTSKQPLPCDKPNQATFNVILRPRGGLKIDFSSGIFISGGGASFAGNTYYYKPVTDSTSTIATPSVKNNLVVSLGALMHIYFRSPALIKPALSVGASLNTGATIYNLHAGPSLIIGNRNRLIFTGGITLRQSTLLDKAYNTTTVYTTALLPATVPTVNKFPVTGWFFSLTYDVSSL